MQGGKEDGVVAGIGIQPNGELAQMARLAVHNGTVNGGAALHRDPRPRMRRRRVAGRRGLKLFHGHYNTVFGIGLSEADIGDLREDLKSL
jgi:hypothetical protein